MQRIEILLSHIRDKNNYKNRDSLFPLVQCFKTTFCYILYNVSKLLFISFSSKFQDVSSLTHKKLFAFSFTIFTSTFLYTHAHSLSCHVISNLLKQKTMSFTFKSSTLQRHLHNFNIVVPFYHNSYE